MLLSYEGGLTAAATDIHALVPVLQSVENLYLKFFYIIL